MPDDRRVVGKQREPGRQSSVGSWQGRVMDAADPQGQWPRARAKAIMSKVPHLTPHTVLESPPKPQAQQQDHNNTERRCRQSVKIMRRQSSTGQTRVIAECSDSPRSLIRLQSRHNKTQKQITKSQSDLADKNRQHHLHKNKNAAEKADTQSHQKTALTVFALT